MGVSRPFSLVLKPQCLSQTHTELLRKKWEDFFFLLGLSHKSLKAKSTVTRVILQFVLYGYTFSSCILEAKISSIAIESKDAIVVKNWREATVNFNQDWLIVHDLEGIFRHILLQSIVSISYGLDERLLEWVELHVIG